MVEVTDRGVMELLAKVSYHRKLIMKVRDSIGNEKKVEKLVEKLKGELGIPVYIRDNPGEYPALVVWPDKDSVVVAFLEIRKGLTAIIDRRGGMLIVPA